MTEFTIRPMSRDDLDCVKQIAVVAEMFTTDEVEFFDEMVDGALDGSLDGHEWIVIESADGDVMAAAQFAPEPFADRLWNLYFIAVDPEHQGTGLGTALMEHVETDLSGRGESEARVLIVETSSTDQYRRTRALYERLGYDEEARIREYYGPGDDKVVFWKSLV